MKHWKRTVAAMAALPMIFAGTTGASAIAAPVPANIPTDGLVAQYSFTDKPVDGKTVPNTAEGSTLGDAVVQNASDGLWSDSALSLTGGAKTSGSWVLLPDDVLAGKESATVQVEVNADAAMTSDFHFLWSIGTESADSNAGEYLFSALKCSDGRSPLAGIKADGTETLVQSGSCVADSNQWLSVTTTFDGPNKTARLYIDGNEVASGSIPSTPADVEQTLNAIGRSPWPDNNFKGKVSTFRIYDTVLSDDAIAGISEADATIHQSDIADQANALLDGLGVDSQEVNDGYIALPTANGSVTWASSNPDVVSPDGKVNQPLQGEDPVTVNMTATAVVRGISATKQVTLTVNPTDKTAQELVDEAAEGYVIPGILRAGDTLPEPVDGTSVQVTATDGITLDGNAVESGEGTITVIIKRDAYSGATSAKTFNVKVLPKSESAYLAAYDRNATSASDANNGDIAYSMHLALADDDTGAYDPLNENYGIFFPLGYRSQPLNMNTVDYARSLKDPSLFRMANGSYGVISVRTNRGTDVADATGSVLVATSDDLLSYDETPNSGSIIDLGETNGVNEPYAVYDSASGHYLIGWKDDNGVAKYTTFTDLAGKDSEHGDIIVGGYAAMGRLDASAVNGIDDFRSGSTIAVDNATVQALETRFGRSTNTGISAIDDITVKEGSSLEDVTSQLPDSVELTYSDGSTGSLPLEDWDTSSLKLDTAGEYTLTATVKQTDYQIPFAEDRADPSVYKWQWTHEVDGKEVTQTKFLMIATNDIYGDCTWQHGTPHMPFRMADTIEGLADTPNDASGQIDANGYNGKEVSLLEAGDLDVDGQPINHSFWAPEIHEIDGRLTILFMAGYGSVWSNGKSVYMQLKQDENGYDLDPSDPNNWTAPKAILRSDGSALATDANGNVGMSLDMTYFQDADGQSYYAWQQLGATYIARMDPSDPSHVTTDPVRIVAPDYAWNVTIAEGPNVTLHDGKLYLMFSGSGVGATYTTGMAVAPASGADLTDPNSWDVLNYPIQKSGPFNGKMQLGTGHGMWSEDEDGNQIYVFHAYATEKVAGNTVNTTGRDMFVRRVHWAADGYPVFDMSLDEELAQANKTVTVNVKVEAESTDPEEPTDPEDPTNSGNPDGTDTSSGTDDDTTAESSDDELSSTGIDVAVIAVAAAVFLMAGAVLTFRRRMMR